MKKRSISRENELHDHLDYMRTSSSETECTGVVYTGPLSEEELENINEIFAFEPEPAKKPRIE